MTRKLFLSMLLGTVPAMAYKQGNGKRYWVSPDGSDAAGTGSKDRPWNTIEHAIERIKPYDQLVVLKDVHVKETFMLSLRID